jgi:hypothetical protein
MDVPVNEYIPHDCTMNAVKTKDAATDRAANIFLFNLISSIFDTMFFPIFPVPQQQPFCFIHA